MSSIGPTRARASLTEDDRPLGLTEALVPCEGERVPRLGMVGLWHHRACRDPRLLGEAGGCFSLGFAYKIVLRNPGEMPAFASVGNASPPAIPLHEYSRARLMTQSLTQTSTSPVIHIQ